MEARVPSKEFSIFFAVEKLHFVTKLDLSFENYLNVETYKRLDFIVFLKGFYFQWPILCLPHFLSIRWNLGVIFTCKIQHWVYFRTKDLVKLRNATFRNKNLEKPPSNIMRMPKLLIVEPISNADFQYLFIFTEKCTPIKNAVWYQNV